MCTVQEAEDVDDGQTTMIKEPKVKLNSCIKCPNAPSVIFRRRNGYCRACFEKYYVHKFRAQLGNTRLIDRNEKVLIAFSGGSSSRTLIHLVAEAVRADQHHRVCMEPFIVHVDETPIVQSTLINADESLSRIQACVESYNLPYEIISLLSVYSHQYPKNAQMFEKLVSSVNTLSARHELLALLRIQAIKAFAQNHGFKKIMVGDCATRLSTNVLNDVSVGRGSNIVLHTAFCQTDPVDQISFLRPLRSFSAKEIAYFNSVNRLDVIAIPNFLFMSTVKSSLQKLTETFIAGLERDFPSTVSTVFRTSEKVQQPMNTDATCIICHSNIDRPPNEMDAALQAILKSQSCQTCSCNHPGDVESGASAQPLLCYGCQIIFRETNQQNSLEFPDYVVQDFQRRSSRESMRSQIAEFLLEEDAP